MGLRNFSAVTFLFFLLFSCGKERSQSLSRAELISSSGESLYSFTESERDTLATILKSAASVQEFNRVTSPAWSALLHVTASEVRTFEIYDDMISSKAGDDVLIFRENQFWLYNICRRELGPPAKEYRTPHF